MSITEVLLRNCCDRNSPIFDSAIKKLNELELIPSKLYVPVNQCENILVERTGVAVPMKYAPTVAKVSFTSVPGCHLPVNVMIAFEPFRIPSA